MKSRDTLIAELGPHRALILTILDADTYAPADPYWRGRITDHPIPGVTMVPLPSEPTPPMPTPEPVPDSENYATGTWLFPDAAVALTNWRPE